MIRLAFLLLDRERPLDPDALLAALRQVEPAAELEPDEDQTGPSVPEGAAVAFGTTGWRLIAVSMPVAIPTGEAEEAAAFSVWSLRTGWKLPTHTAHLMITLQEDEKPRIPIFQRLVRFTRLLAGLAGAIEGVVGVYWGDSGATHDRDFFMEVASEPEMLPVLLWNGVSTARQGQRISLLSLGMKQLCLPNLLLTAPAQQAGEALSVMFDLLAYLARRGKPIPEGDTVGRSAKEKLAVRYEPSPIDPADRVWCVDLP